MPGAWVDISNNLSWNTHVDQVTASVNKSLGFMKGNVKNLSPGNGLLDPCISPAGVDFSYPDLLRLSAKAYGSIYRYLESPNPQG